MALSDAQRDLLSCLHDAFVDSDEQQFEYHREWLGYLPYGLYHWITSESGGSSHVIASDGTLQWNERDLLELENAGFIETTCRCENPDDFCDVTIAFTLGKNLKSVIR